MRIQIGVAFVGLLAHAVGAQSPSATTGTTPLGTWRGRSVCLVSPSACTDEVVVYRITRLETADSVAVDARKVVRGEEQEMGVLSCQLLASGVQITCTIPQGVWTFGVHGDSLTGGLVLKDNTKYRDVRAIRSR
jgi:hypothetical protein